MHTAEFESVVLCTPRSLTLWCNAHRGVWLCGVMHTAESNFVVFCTPRSPTLRCYAHRGLFLTIWLRGVMLSSKSDSALWWTTLIFLRIRLSRQNRNRIQEYLSVIPQRFLKIRLSRRNRNRIKKFTGTSANSKILSVTMHSAEFLKSSIISGKSKPK